MEGPILGGRYQGGSGCLRLPVMSMRLRTNIPATWRSRRPSRRSSSARAHGTASRDGRARRLAHHHHADLAAFIAAQTSVFLATANADGQPYIQHRGGPAGFLHVLDDKTIALRGFLRQPAIYLQRQFGRQPQGAPVPDRLCEPAAHQDLGRGTRRRGRSRLIAALMPRATRRGRAGDGVHGHGLGFQLPAAHPAALRGGRCRRGTGCATGASPSWRRRSRG